MHSRPDAMGKRERVARAADALGLTRLVEYIRRRPVLLVLNYHRIGSPVDGECDPALFSASADCLEAQVRFLKQRYSIVSLREALDGLAKGLREPSILLTFDDGYLDNYRLAFPILKSYRVPATFFLATAYIGTDRLPWWDAIALMLRRSRRAVIKLRYPRPVSIDLGNFRSALRFVLELYKMPAMQAPGRFLAELVEATGVERPECSSQRLFLTWEEAKEMVRCGMDIGSHTHTHPILGKLPLEDQIAEFGCSRELLRAHAGVDVTALAYPVGKLTSISEETSRALAETGYQAAFSFYGGVNVPGRTDLYNIRRNAMRSDYSPAHLRLMVSVMFAAGRNV